MLNRCLLALTALLCCVTDIDASTYTILVNGNVIHDPNGVVQIGGSTSITVTCRLGRAEPNAKIVFEKIVNGQTFTLNNYPTSFSGPYTLWTYTLNDTDKQIPVSTYRCRDKGNENCPDYVQVTLYSVGPRPPPGAPIPGCSPGGMASPPPSTTRSSSGSGTNSPSFTGLNPLIYTISAVILLGTLAIVAIITCWIRARRSYNRRMFQATTNPQDYLDYISDNEFTPLTTSEFVASLQERPPTYHESEEIEGQMRPDDSGEGSADGGEGSRGSGARSTQEGSGNGEVDGGDEASGGGERVSTWSMSSGTRVPPPSPMHLTSSSRRSSTPQASSSTESDHRSPTERGTEAGATHSTASEDPPNVTEDRTSTSAHLHDSDGHGSQPLSSAVAAGGDVQEITENRPITGSSNEPVLGGIDDLLSMDMEIGNLTQHGSRSQLRSVPPPSGESTAAVGMLIDLDSGSTSADVVSSSQSTFPRFLQEPTPEQISEIEAAIGAINEHMTQIRERTE